MLQWDQMTFPARRPDLLDKGTVRMKTMKIALGLVFVYLMVNCVNLINQEMRLQNYQARLDTDIAKVRSEQTRLKEDLKYFNTSAGVEELARKRLGYYKKGEIPLRVIESAPKPETGAIQSSQRAEGAAAAKAPTVELTGPVLPL
ncbi:MAG: hypothetical protein CVV27_16730 [Candidatus Melainabacteria bacterium HGW-Melainabacteria-1]|nr:MAG: hypothetical protein CVV27_16730 [Candidatus Melainabacteria bacterium HGW-Melainabacteria-1]